MPQTIACLPCVVGGELLCIGLIAEQQTRIENEWHQWKYRLGLKKRDKLEFVGTPEKGAGLETEDVSASRDTIAQDSGSTSRKPTSATKPELPKDFAKASLQHSRNPKEPDVTAKASQIQQAPNSGKAMEERKNQKENQIRQAPNSKNVVSTSDTALFDVNCGSMLRLHCGLGSQHRKLQTKDLASAHHGRHHDGVPHQLSAAELCEVEEAADLNELSLRAKLASEIQPAAGQDESTKHVLCSIGRLCSVALVSTKRCSDHAHSVRHVAQKESQCVENSSVPTRSLSVEEETKNILEAISTADSMIWKVQEALKQIQAKRSRSVGQTKFMLQSALIPTAKNESAVDSTAGCSDSKPRKSRTMPQLDVIDEVSTADKVLGVFAMMQRRKAGTSSRHHAQTSPVDPVCAMTAETRDEKIQWMPPLRDDLIKSLRDEIAKLPSSSAKPLFEIVARLQQAIHDTSGAASASAELLELSEVRKVAEQRREENLRLAQAKGNWEQVNRAQELKVKELRDKVTQLQGDLVVEREAHYKTKCINEELKQGLDAKTMQINKALDDTANNAAVCKLLEQNLAEMSTKFEQLKGELAKEQVDHCQTREAKEELKQKLVEILSQLDSAKSSELLKFAPLFMEENDERKSKPTSSERPVKTCMEEKDERKSQSINSEPPSREKSGREVTVDQEPARQLAEPYSDERDSAKGPAPQERPAPVADRRARGRSRTPPAPPARTSEEECRDAEAAARQAEDERREAEAADTVEFQQKLEGAVNEVDTAMVSRLGRARQRQEKQADSVRRPLKNLGTDFMENSDLEVPARVGRLHRALLNKEKASPRKTK